MKQQIDIEKLKEVYKVNKEYLSLNGKFRFYVVFWFFRFINWMIKVCPEDVAEKTDWRETVEMANKDIEYLAQLK